MFRHPILPMGKSSKAFEQFNILHIWYFCEKLCFLVNKYLEISSLLNTPRSHIYKDFDFISVLQGRMWYPSHMHDKTQHKTWVLLFSIWSSIFVVRALLYSNLD